MEDLIASTLRFILKVLIGQEFSSKQGDKAEWAGLYTSVVFFLFFLFCKLDVDQSFDRVSKKIQKEEEDILIPQRVNSFFSFIDMYFNPEI